VVSTRVGYAGGSTVDPTYYRLGDQSETVEITYDPTAISYGELLEVFWKAGAGRVAGISRQYASIIHYHDEAQRLAAIASLATHQAESGRTLAVDIQPAGPFYLAEAYHQKYYLRRLRVVAREYEALYPSLDAFVGSTAVARANGYVGGYGTRAQLEVEIDALGLSEEGRVAMLGATR